ncbi:hypothetical protein [Natrinema salifodinae]|uniref:Uncharacterized protein n=1 Tax=Natrinema salifodinae TaxID=1202768 RepID=A0A1I0PSK6_9EURY|nr:hypothetical protein [Natrinema salifodinae]SEW17357.1 hypothetical protein SAMN05216285_2894 [Natrinema salifodinae]
MSTRHRIQPDHDSTPNRTRTRTRTDSRPRTTPTSASTAPTDSQSATGRAPRTFSHRNQARLENLMDEWNAAFANASPDDAA